MAPGCLLSTCKPMLTPTSSQGPGLNRPQPQPAHLTSEAPSTPNLLHPRLNLSAVPSLRSSIWLCCLSLRAPPTSEGSASLRSEGYQGDPRSHTPLQKHSLSPCSGPGDPREAQPSAQGGVHARTWALGSARSQALFSSCPLPLPHPSLEPSPAQPAPARTSSVSLHFRCRPTEETHPDAESAPWRAKTHERRCLPVSTEQPGPLPARPPPR